MKRVHGASAALLCLAAASVMAQGMGQGMRPNPGEGRRNSPRTMEMEGRMLHWLANDPKAAEELLLKEEQQAALKTNLFELRKTTIELNAKMELAAVNQAELMSSETINEDAVMKAVEETARMRAEIAKANARYLLAVLKILSPEQRKKLKDMRAERMEAWRENRAKRMGPPAGAVPPGPHPPALPIPAE